MASSGIERIATAELLSLLENSWDIDVYSCVNRARKHAACTGDDSADPQEDPQPRPTTGPRVHMSTVGLFDDPETPVRHICRSRCNLFGRFKGRPFRRCLRQCCLTCPHQGEHWCSDCELTSDFQTESDGSRLTPSGPSTSSSSDLSSEETVARPAVKAPGERETNASGQHPVPAQAPSEATTAPAASTAEAPSGHTIAKAPPAKHPHMTGVRLITCRTGWYIDKVRFIGWGGWSEEWTATEGFGGDLPHKHPLEMHEKIIKIVQRNWSYGFLGSHLLFFLSSGRTIEIKGTHNRKITKEEKILEAPQGWEFTTLAFKDSELIAKPHLSWLVPPTSFPRGNLLGYGAT